MTSENIDLKYRKLWLFIGYMLIAIVVYQTLTAHPIGVELLSFSDKFLHTVGYFVLMGWFVQIYHGRQQRILWALFFIIMGVVMEFLQDLSGVRFYEVNDMLANGLGVMLAWILSNTKFSNIILMFEKVFLKVVN